MVLRVRRRLSNRTRNDGMSPRRGQVLESPGPLCTTWAGANLLAHADVSLTNQGAPGSELEPS